MKMVKRIVFPHFNLSNLQSRRYVASSDKNRLILDLKTNKTYSFPPYWQMRGVPRNPRISLGTVRRGTQWFGNLGQTLFFDGRTAIFAYTKTIETSTSRGGAPLCTNRNTRGVGNSRPCTGRAVFAPTFQGWYCASCKKLVRRSTYLRVTREMWLVTYDRTTRRARLRRTFRGSAFVVLGMGPRGKYVYLYSYKMAKVGKTDKVGKTAITFRKVEVSTGKQVWKYSLTVPLRRDRSGAFSKPIFRNCHSDDFSKIAVWEHDEWRGRSRKGSLKSPTARGYVVDIVKSAHVEFAAPVTLYGHTFDAKNRYLFVGSYLTGRISRLNLATGKFDKHVASGRSIFHMGRSGGDKTLYVVNKRAVHLHAMSTLKRVGTMRFSTFYPGFRSLLQGCTKADGIGGVLVLPGFVRIGSSRTYNYGKRELRLFKLVE